jgi:putative DNA-invertase from lambdoid prophage Rac
LGQAAALYCRVSTADQTCARQESDLRAFAKKAGYKVVGVWKETASGAKDERGMPICRSLNRHPKAVFAAALNVLKIPFRVFSSDRG